MLKDRPSLAFFALIATSLCAAVVLVALLIAGDVAGPRVVAMNNFRHTLRPVTDNDSRCYPEADPEARGAETYWRHYSGRRFYLRPDPCVGSCAADF